jgi:hypothetical protein
MELVGAPANELKTLLTASFEEWSREGRRARFRRRDRPMIFLTGDASGPGRLEADHAVLGGRDAPCRRTDPDSNYGLAERMLLSPLGARRRAAIACLRSNTRISPAALWYDDALATELDNGPLGSRDSWDWRGRAQSARCSRDTKRCSLRICERSRSRTAPKPPSRRLSLTLRYVLQTKKIWVIAIGPRKLPVLQAAIDKTSHSTPLDLLMRQAKGRRRIHGSNDS